jgi:4-amino-4-deoxy-L-arabinose transferase-like glycosyltransferase
MDRDEPRFAEASREMFQRKDLIVPWFNGQYRFDKPPLIYWCQIGCYQIFGENEFAARLPSVLFTVATAVLLLVWGRQLGNEHIGLRAAIFFITSLQVLIHGRLAVADMPMIFFVAAAMWSGWEMTRITADRRGFWWWIFFGSLGLGFLAKGPVAWLPLAGLFVGRWLRPTEFQLSVGQLVVGVLLSLGLVGLWGVPALLATHGQFFTVGIGRHVVYRSLGIMEGHGGSGWVGFLATLPLYFITFFFSFFPWAFKVPGAVRNWWGVRDQDTLGWYLFVQAALIFIVFSLVRTKLPHYTLPAFPAISLWLALRTRELVRAPKWLTVGTTAMCLLGLAVTWGGFSVARRYFVAANLWCQAQPYCSADMKLASIGFNEPSLVWEFRRGLTNYLQQLDLQEAGPFLQSPGPRILILPTASIVELGTLSSNYLTFRASGLDTARFRRIDLTAVVKTGR